jgi:glycosyltransferase involved in cell wall biosynthesis
MKIAFLTSRDPQKKDSWSSITFFMAQALQKHCGEVSYIGTLYVPPKEELIGRIINKCTRLLFKKNYNYYLSILMSKRYAKIAARQLAGQQFDVIVAPMGWAEIAFLKTDIPTIFVGDSTLGLLFNTYPACSNLVDVSYREMEMIEKRVTINANALIYSSSWAAQSAIDDYHVDPAKVHVVSMGANFDHPLAKEVILQKRKSSSCKLLFVGVDWQRKGGKIAFETLLALEKMGIMAELTICGCTPPKQFVHERMHIIPFLDKHDPEHYNRLVQLYLEADFLLLPTRYDCTPIVFGEANAYGLPVITTQTGGVSEVVRDGENGFVLPLDAHGDEYAKVIASVYQDDERYTRLVCTSRAAYDERLNWDAWGKSMNTILSEMVDQGKGHPYHPEPDRQLVASVS